MSRHFLDFVGLVVPGDAGNDVMRLVGEHPDLDIPAQETHYFSSDKLSEGKEWYEQHFKESAPGRKRGEFSTSYLAVSGVSARIVREYPDAKLLAVLTNPIESVTAIYSEAKQSSRSLSSLEQFLESQPRLLEQFRFGRQLITYLTYYSPVDFLVTTLDEVRAAPVASIGKMYEHIGVDKNFLPTVLLATVVEDTGKPSRLARLLRLDVLRANKLAKAKAVAAQLFPYPAAPVTTREYDLLAQYYYEDVYQLGNTLHTDFVTKWRYPKPVVGKQK